jgi:hypothetical protein
VAKIHHFAIYKKSQATLLMELIGKNPQKSPNWVRSCNFSFTYLKCLTLLDNSYLSDTGLGFTRGKQKKLRSKQSMGLILGKPMVVEVMGFIYWPWLPRQGYCV